MLCLGLHQQIVIGEKVKDPTHPWWTSIRSAPTPLLTKRYKERSTHQDGHFQLLGLIPVDIKSFISTEFPPAALSIPHLPHLKIPLMAPKGSKTRHKARFVDHRWTDAEHDQVVR